MMTALIGEPKEDGRIDKPNTYQLMSVEACFTRGKICVTVHCGCVAKMAASAMEAAAKRRTESCSSFINVGSVCSKNSKTYELLPLGPIFAATPAACTAFPRCLAAALRTMGVSSWHNSRYKCSR